MTPIPTFTHPDWLVQTLIDRCKEDGVVDREELSLIASLNFEGDTTALDYGEIIHQLGRAVAAKGGILALPNVEDYDKTELLKAPSDWLGVWSDEKTIPDRFELGASFDRYSATTPDGRPLVIDGPGGHSFEAWEAHSRNRERILEERRLRRLSKRSGQPR